MFLDRAHHILRLSLHSLLVHQLRSILTILGIVLGVGSVIVMLSVGEAARYEAIQQIQELGATNIIVRSVKPMDDSKKDADQETLTYGFPIKDKQPNKETIPRLISITPI